MDKLRKYRLACTLTFGDIYGQIIVWLITITLSLASAMALMGARRPYYALATVGLIYCYLCHFCCLRSSRRCLTTSN